MDSQFQTPPPQPPKEAFGRRYKFLWPLLLTVNLGVGAYLFMRPKDKNTSSEEEVANDISSGSASPVAATAGSTELSLPPQLVLVPLKPQKQIPEDQQRELFKWILEERRKIKSKDPEERKRIDEEKAILKQFLRSKSIPTV